jgi:exosortase J
MDPELQAVPSETTGRAPSDRRQAKSADSTFPTGEAFSAKHRSAWAALLVSLLVVVGSYSLLPIWLFISRIWLNDPLRSIGAVFPLIALAGIMVAWRRIGWTMNGTFWGLPVLALSLVLARLTSFVILGFRVHQQSESVLHTGPVMFLYGAGAVLVFGGTKLLRVSIAPLCLLLLINPVPHSFNTAVDLPLQYMSAITARHFAHLIGLQPSGEQLRMMFTPNFGMMIVPGCNGVRGSITLGYLTLIFGYMRRLRPRVLTLTAVGALFLGYILNLLRLCILVVYYRIGVSLPSIQKYGAGIDYAIGCTLFLFATLAVGLFIRWMEPKEEQQKTNAVAKAEAPVSAVTKSGYATGARALCFLILVLVFIVPTLGAGSQFHATRISEQAVLNSFPTQVGPYRLIRTYAEYDGNGSIQFALADYSTAQNSADSSNKLTLGLYLGPTMHLAAYSKFAQGVRPNWSGSLDVVDGSAQQPLSVHFVTTLYDDGIRRQYNAETSCYETGCSASIGPIGKRFFFSRPVLSDIFFSAGGSRLPILLRRELLDSDGAPTATQLSQFEADALQFTQQLNLRALLREDGTPI